MSNLTSSFALLLLLVLYACSPTATNNNNQPNLDETAALSPKTSFFDLATFIENEVDQLNAQKLTINKKIIVNGKSEEKRIDEVDFTNDLELFRKAGINKPAWADKYRVTNVGNDTSYIAIDSSLRTQQLQVIRNDNNEVERIEIKRRSGNLISSGAQDLSYHKGTGYRIYSQQTSDLVGNAKVLVEVSF